MSKKSSTSAGDALASLRVSITCCTAQSKNRVFFPKTVKFGSTRPLPEKRFRALVAIPEVSVFIGA